MIYPKKLLKSLSAAIQNKSTQLDYVWQPVSRYDQIKPITAYLNYLFLTNLAAYKEFIDSISSHINSFNEIPLTNSKKDNIIYWDNHYFPGLDVICLYTMVLKYKPSQIIEIGSGNSTIIMRKAISDGGMSTHITCIDPHPRREIKNSADQWIASPLENIKDWALFSNLKAGDIVFFDGSHTSLANTDVTVFFLEVLPLVPEGVLIQIHDIYLPFDYPQDMVERGYNEQYLLAQTLHYGKNEFEILFPCFFTYRHPELNTYMQEKIWSHIKLNDQIEQHGGSIWFMKK